MMDGTALIELRPAMWMRSRIIQSLPVISPTNHPLAVWAGARLEHFWQPKAGSKERGRKKKEREITISQSIN